MGVFSSTRLATSWTGTRVLDRLLGWAEELKIELVHIQPGRPMQNGHVESFHGRLRDECLNASWFRTLGDVRQKLADWQQKYNRRRPGDGMDETKGAGQPVSR